MGKTTLTVPESLRKNLRSRRSLPGTAVAPTEAGVNRQFKRIQTQYSVKTRFGGDNTHARIFAAGLAAKTEPALRSVRKGAHELLMEPSLDAVRRASVDVIGAAEAMLRRADSDSTLLDAVVVARGLPDAVRVALRCTDFELAAMNGYTNAVYVVTNTDHVVSWGERWRPLRDALCAAQKPDYDAAVEVARKLRIELDLARRTEIAYTFPDQPWANEELLASVQARSAAPNADVRPQILLSAITSIEALRAYVDAWGERVNLAPYALDMVHVMPEKDLLPILAAELPTLLVKPKYGPLAKTPPRMIAEAIACWRSPAVAAVLAAHVSHPVMAPLVLGFFRDAPELGAALSEKAGAKRTPSMERVLGNRPAEKAKKMAKASEVPPILRDRPWRAPSGKARAAREVLLLTMSVGKESVALTKPVREFEASNGSNVFRDMTKPELERWKKERAKKEWGRADYEHERVKGSNTAWEYRRVPNDLAIKAWNEGECGLSQTELQWVARHGVKVLPGFTTRDWLRWLSYDGEHDFLNAVMSFVSPRIAPDVAKAASRKRARSAALAWLARNPGAAAQGLVPNALGKDGEAQRDADAALRQLSQNGHRGEVEKAAKAYGKDAARLVGALLGRDPLALDVAPPKPPPFLRLAELSDVTLRSGQSIGDDARAALVELLQITPNDVPYAGALVVRKACDAASLGRLAEELLEQWVLGDLPGRHEWMMFACAHYPSESATRRVVALTREWSRKNAAKAARLCAGLAAIGSDAALMALAHVADTTRYDVLKKAASQLVADAAAARGLTKDELADRTVPDVGLDPKGTLQLSFGARAFVVTLDENLAPVVREKSKAGASAAAGSLPRPQKTDDASAAKAARERFVELKNDLAAITQRQLRRFEHAMVEGRSWSAQDFRERIAGHPLLTHLSRRLVWEASPKKGAARCFRVTEDGSLSDEHDRSFTLEDGASVRLAHPARTPSVTTTWAKLFADYELLQPFPQVGREVHTIAKAESAAKSLTRTAGIVVAPKKFIGVLESRGWERRDASMVGTFLKTVQDASGGPLRAELPLSKGVEIAYLRDAPDAATEAIIVHALDDDRPIALGKLDAVSFSELVADIQALTQSSR